ncbi:MAG: RecQ family ATP-dependent DNA helicase [Paludibacteraceae bacterium]|nr:RecQ family ATP-dependent DNA helicase [Paludibacteraceae bacterium]MBN2787841.1 RecQ family ATP-dependent DNA helicase [Paludibacteraceae bacterium]
MEKYLHILKEYWGYNEFRSLQEDIIQSVAAKKDTLALMPTGGGKSITFQVPAMQMEGICLVITPLIALMKDQVENLKARRIKAAAIFSGMTQEEIIVTLDNCLYGGYKFLYVSPERLSTELFLSRLKLMNVSLIAVDESHCISQWGYDFRPSYLRIAEIREHLPTVPLLALTATATPEVVKDIQLKLHFPKENVFQKSFERKNVAYVVREVEDKNHLLLTILKKVAGASIVYVRNRKKTKEIADFLNENNIPAAHYHAGLTNQQKDLRQNNWKKNQTRVIVATNAFGMGIDKPDVRSVIHLDLPDSLEAYFQEAGRAGRDEKKAYAILIYNKSDSTKIKKRLSDNFPDKKNIRTVYEKLAHYFQVAVGSGEGVVYPFNLIDFCKIFKLSILPTYNSLKILELAGYLELTDELDNPSRILFTIKRDELYFFQTNNAQLDQLIQLLLRSYTGLFTEYAHINEDVLAQRLKQTRETIYQQLLSLNRLGIVHYIPAKKTPFIIYTCNRIDTDKIQLNKVIYDERKERYEKRAEQLLSYATQGSVCRSQFLLRYFGQTNIPPCQQCDICLKKNEQEVKQEEFNAITTSIKEQLSIKPMTLSELVMRIKKKEDKLLAVIRFMTDNNLIMCNLENKFELKT